MRFIYLVASLVWFSLGQVAAQRTTIRPGETWADESGTHINAHGGNILFHNGRYYWYGEHRIEHIQGASEDGISCYTSPDLLNWKSEGLVLHVENDETSDIALGCIMERPKVVYNPRTRKFVMIFHLELKGQGYRAARTGFAVSDTPTGPFRFIRSLRPNAGKWPADFKRKDKKKAMNLNMTEYKEWWTPQWRKAIEDGLFLVRDMKGGQMSRDMTVYVDDDGRAYHLFSSEDNLTLHLAELTKDYLDYTGRFYRIAAGGQNEAPCLFKKDGYYWLITSGCTGWAPNKARMFRAQTLKGPWEQLETPFKGKDAQTTFHSQGTYIMEDPLKKGEFIFMADRWNPRKLSDSRYIWLPIAFENGLPVIRWQNEWSW